MNNRSLFENYLNKNENIVISENIINLSSPEYIVLEDNFVLLKTKIKEITSFNKKTKDLDIFLSPLLEKTNEIIDIIKEVKKTYKKITNQKKEDVSIIDVNKFNLTMEIIGSVNIKCKILLEYLIEIQEKIELSFESLEKNLIKENYFNGTIKENLIGTIFSIFNNFFKIYNNRIKLISVEFNKNLKELEKLIS